MTNTETGDAIEVDLHAMLDLGYQQMPSVARREARLRIAAGIGGRELFQNLDALVDMKDAERHGQLRTLLSRIKGN